MKKTLLALSLVLLAIGAQAQTTNTTPAQNFFYQVADWVQTYNTSPDHNWTNASIQMDSGIATVTGVGISDRLEIQKNFGSFGAGVAGEFTGVGSAFNSIEGTFNY